MSVFTEIFLGTSADDDTGSNARAAGQIINDNFALAGNKTEDNSWSGSNKFTGFFGTGARIAISIVSGVLTATGTNIRVSGEGGVADNLDTINGGSEGDIIILSRGVGTVTVTEIGNIVLGDTTRIISSSGDRLVLHMGATNWDEISYSDNS